MTPMAITSTLIDDVLIVRKSRRMTATIRQEFKSADARRRYRDIYVNFIDQSRYYPDVFQRMINKIQERIDEADPDPNTVLSQGHF